MSHHPWGRTVKILGIQSLQNGRSCKEHPICSHVLQEDSVVHFRKVKVLIDGKEESAIAAFWVSDGIDRCRVGYLPKFHVTLWKSLEHAAQITEIYTEDSESPTKRQKHYRNSGCAIGALISPPLLVCPPLSPTKKCKKRKKHETCETSPEQESKEENNQNEE